MSANLHIDCQNTALFVPSVSAVSLSGAQGVIGQWVDLRNSDTYCNVYFSVGACSGPLQFQVQCAPGPWDIPLTANAFSGNIFSGGAPMSGSFTDPTSGLAQLPTTFTSGGLVTVNSGLYTLPGSANVSGTNLTAGAATFTLPFGTNPIQVGQGGVGTLSGSYPVCGSGGIAFAAFQRPYQYARINLISGATIPPFVQAGFFAQLMTTGSGAGFSQQPFPTTTVNV